jgi:hypothetical protein
VRSPPPGSWSSTRSTIDRAAFSEHHGFVVVPGNRQRLVQKIGDIAAALGR